MKLKLANIRKWTWKNTLMEPFATRVGLSRVATFLALTTSATMQSVTNDMTGTQRFSCHASVPTQPLELPPGRKKITMSSLKFKQYDLKLRQRWNLPVISDLWSWRCIQEIRMISWNTTTPEQTCHSILDLFRLIKAAGVTASQP